MKIEIIKCLEDNFLNISLRFRNLDVSSCHNEDVGMRNPLFRSKLSKFFSRINLFRFSKQTFSICCTIRRPKISPPKVIYTVQSMPYKSLPLGAFWTVFGRNFPTGVPELLYPYQPANPLVEYIFKASTFFFEN